MSWTRTVVSLLCVLGIADASAAASISVVNPGPIGVGQTTSATIVLTLSPGDDASIFEGVIGLVGLSSTASVSLVAGGFGPTWDGGAFGNVLVAQQQLLLSLTASSNRSDHTLLATIDITGLQPGTLDLVLLAGTFLQRDLNTPPFFESLPLSPLAGATLASIVIVPEPTLLALLGLSAARLRRRRDRSRVRPSLNA